MMVVNIVELPVLMGKSGHLQERVNVKSTVGRVKNKVPGDST